MTTDRPGKATPLRERNKASRRLRIEEAAFALMREKGFAATTIDEIAEAAEVSKSTFMRYFSTKEAVIFNTSEEDFAALRKAVASGAEQAGLIESLQTTISQFSRYFAMRRELLLARYEIESQNPQLEPHRLMLQRRWETVIYEGLLDRPHADPRLSRILAAIARSVLTSAVDEWQAAGAHESLEQLVSEYFESFRGIVSLERDDA